MYDYLIVGAGLFGATLAYKLKTTGKRVLVIDKKDVVGGTVYTDVQENIPVHRYGAHIFRTDDADVWNFFTRFTEFVPFVNTPIAICKGVAYNMPFNMNTFAKLWNVTTPDEAKAIIKLQTSKYAETVPGNLEEFALATVGYDIYDNFIKGYTEKQWNKPCSELPVSTMSRIPIRLTYNNNYYSARFQGVPINGYTPIILSMLDGVDVLFNIDGEKFVKSNPTIANKIIYTGRIDEFFGFNLGKLEYRSLRFEHKVFDVENKQGVAVVNWSDADVPQTRTIEHKHFTGALSNKTVVSYEYPAECSNDNEAYYPINTDANNALYEKYLKMNNTGIIFAGRLGKYRYYDMSDTITEAIKLADKLLKEDR